MPHEEPPDAAFRHPSSLREIWYLWYLLCLFIFTFFFLADVCWRLTALDLCVCVTVFFYDFLFLSFLIESTFCLFISLFFICFVIFQYHILFWRFIVYLVFLTFMFSVFLSVFHIQNVFGCLHLTTFLAKTQLNVLLFSCVDVSILLRLISLTVIFHISTILLRLFKKLLLLYKVKTDWRQISHNAAHLSLFVGALLLGKPMLRSGAPLILPFHKLGSRSSDSLERHGSQKEAGMHFIECLNI